MSKILTLKKFDKQGNEIFGETVSAVFNMVEGQYRVSSVDVAKIFDKAHKDMIKHMKEIAAWDDYVGKGNIAPTPYIHPQNNQTYVSYMFNKVAFDLFVLSLTGAGPSAYKRSYVEAFNKLLEEHEAKVLGDISLEKIIHHEVTSKLDNVVLKNGEIEIGDFSKMLMSRTKGVRMGRNRMYKLLKAMGLVSQTTNRHLDAGNEYLDTKMNDRGFSYVVVRGKEMVGLIKLIEGFVIGRYEEYPELRPSVDEENLNDLLEDDDNNIFKADKVERLYYEKHHVYEQMTSAKDDMLDTVFRHLDNINHVGDYTIDLNGNFVDDGYQDATFTKPSITIKRDKHGNTTIWND